MLKRSLCSYLKLILKNEPVMSMQTFFPLGIEVSLLKSVVSLKSSLQIWFGLAFVTLPTTTDHTSPCSCAV